jgi:hypothetical protein
MKYELKSYSTGGIIGQGFNLYIDNFFPLILISIGAGIPMFLLSSFTEYNFSSHGGTGVFTLNISYSITYFVNSIFIYISAGLMIEIISKRYLGEKTGFSDYIHNTLSIIFSIIGMSVIVSLIISCGILLFVIPGIVLSLGLSIVEYVLVIERKGIIASIRRSWELTKGRKLSIMGLYFMAGLISVPLYLILLYISSVFLTENYFINNLFIQIIAAILRPFYSCILILLYFNLRIEKEGFNVEYLAERFSSLTEENESDT